MKTNKGPLSGRELVEWEAGRDLVAEINEALDQVRAGDPFPTRVVDVSLAAHARRMSGFSQAAFATKLGVSIRTYQEWEQGRRAPTGAARVLLHLISKKPELVSELV